MQGGPIFFSFLLFLVSIFLITLTHRVNASNPPSHPPTSSSNQNKQVYLIYISDQPPVLESGKAEDYYIQVLVPVLGSEKAAKDALVYSYDIVSGFVAKLTPDQASRLKQHRGILYVIRETKYSLVHKGLDFIN